MGAGFLALLAPALIGAMPAEQRCAALAAHAPEGVSIETAGIVSGGVRTFDGKLIQTAPACRIRGIARPTPRSRIGFELWLPRDRWNGRYYQLGNGGFAGNIDLPSLVAEVARGNAAAITDTGHVADGFDARWAADHPERVVDYGHRSIKATSDAAQALITAYYGHSPAHRYFVGCSNGGRQALMAAQRYPEDWNGVIAGAPANLWTRQLTSFAVVQHRLRAVPGAWIRPDLLPLIRKRALASCPAASVRNGIAIDPRLCPFDPAVLQCRGRAQSACLSAAQVESLAIIQAAGFEPTSATPENWGRWIVNPDPAAPSQLTFATQAFRHLLQDRTDWAITAFEPDRDRASDTLRTILDADDTGFAPFRKRGGRILSYFGWDDAVISPRVGADYYSRVSKRLGAKRTRDFYRLFMVPGMTHCQGGPGAYAFGQSLPAPALAGDRHHDIRRTLEAWVERGVAPDMLVAARYRDEDPAKGVEARQTLAPFAP